MESSGELLKLMNGCMKTSTVASTMMAMSKEMFKAGVMDEMVSDAMGSALDEPDMEEESEAEVQRVLQELAVDSVRVMPAAGRSRAAAQPQQLAAPEEEEDAAEMSGLQARLDGLRAA
jgi:charged multivesicular body protein 3